MHLSTEIAAAQTFMDTLRDVRSLPLDDFPDRFLQLFDAVPLVEEQDLARSRDKARSWAAEMKMLRTNHDVKDSERLIAELDESLRA